MQAESSQAGATNGQVFKDNNDPWQQKTSLMLEGGGTRGFASLLMLRQLMRTIERIEKEYSNEPHDSSFGPKNKEANGSIGNHPRDVASNQASGLAELDVPRKRRTLTLRFGKQNGEEQQQKLLEQRKARVRDELRRRKVFLPCHYFDYIAGTSTGGLNAIMLGRLRMSVDECIERYPQMARNIFGKKRRSFRGALRARYDCAGLEKEMRTLVDERMPDNPERYWLMFKSPDDLCRTVVVAKAIDKNGNSGDPYLFRTYDHKAHINDPKFRDYHLNPGEAHDCEIWQAGRATSAAPSYFDEIKIGNTKYSDGSIGHNDPSALVYREILVKEGVYDERKSHHNTLWPVSLVLTLGTGLRPRKRDRAKGLVAKQKQLRRLNNILNQIIHQSTDSRSTEQFMESAASNRGVNYWKWSGGDVIGGVKLDECKDDIFTSMQEWIADYTSQESVREEIEQCARLLVHKRRERYEKTPDQWRRFTFSTRIKCLICPEDNLGTREEARQHILTDHQARVKDKPIGEILDILQEISPWTLRGPFSHDTRNQ